jgi:DNA helicase-2/ATP-dependent DNA helicase PcrA
MSQLNGPQAEAVEHARGPLLIFAGAGSGKTRTITYRVANLLAEHRVPPYRILCVTFTNKAAGEMRARLEQLAGASMARDLWVGTFHAVCARLLRRYPDGTGLTQRFVIYDDSDQRAVMARLLKDMGVDERRYPPKYVLSRVLAEKREGRGPSEMIVNQPFEDELIEAYERYQKALTTADAVDFEDLIVHVMRLAERRSAAGEELRSRFSHVLVDEFQDTNITQYRLVRALSATTRNLCVVGDDDQSIYSWRGANVRIIRGFRRDFPDATVIKLEQNYRSTANVVAAALGVIEPARDREPKRLWTSAEAGEPVRLREVQDEREEASFVVRTIQREIQNGVSPREMAVFYRVHAQSRVLEEALRSENVPYQIIGGMKFFERAEIKDLVAYLRLLDNPRSDADLLRIINVPTRGIGNKTVQRLLEVATERGTSVYGAIEPTLSDPALGSAGKKKLAGFFELLEDLRNHGGSAAPHELAERVLERSGYRETLREQDTAESDARLGNLEEFVGSIAEYESDCEEAGETPSLGGYLERVTLASAVDSQADAPAVSLMTVHSAKGLEFHTVLLTGMEEEVFPYRGVEGSSPEELEEERRLAYVAITRARVRLFVTHAGCRTLFGQTRYLAPSRFLSDMPNEAVDRVRAAPRPSAASWSRSTEPLIRAMPRRSEPMPLPSERRVVDREAFDDLADESSGREIRPGHRVFHRRFGQGTIEEVEPGATSVVARFPGYGTRRILTQFLEFR